MKKKQTRSYSVLAKELWKREATDEFASKVEVQPGAVIAPLFVGDDVEVHLHIHKGWTFDSVAEEHGVKGLSEMSLRIYYRDDKGRMMDCHWEYPSDSPLKQSILAGIPPKCLAYIQKLDVCLKNLSPIWGKLGKEESEISERMNP